uniref:Uncharacterized protein n=1 Tax=Arundo donax TaxID=35708 RepID=A0A0A9BPH4_ARUDO
MNCELLECIEGSRRDISFQFCGFYDLFAKCCSGIESVLLL